MLTLVTAASTISAKALGSARVAASRWPSRRVVLYARGARTKSQDLEAGKHLIRMYSEHRHEMTTGRSPHARDLAEVAMQDSNGLRYGAAHSRGSSAANTRPVSSPRAKTASGVAHRSSLVEAKRTINSPFPDALASAVN